MTFIRFYLVLFFIAITSAHTIGQDVYKASWGLDGPLLAGGIGLVTTAHIINKKVPAFEEEELNLLDVEKLFKIDRKATGWYSSRAKLTSDIFLRTSFLLPFSLLVKKVARDEFGVIGLMYIEGLTINTALTNLAKGTARRARPYLYNSNVPLDVKLNWPDARRSFFSGHTSTTTMFSFMTAQMYSDFFPDSKLKPIVWSAAVLLPATTGLMRIRAGKHFLTDVAVGFVVGGLIGYFIPVLHRN